MGPFIRDADSTLHPIHHRVFSFGNIIIYILLLRSAKLSCLSGNQILVITKIKHIDLEFVFFV